MRGSTWPAVTFHWPIFLALVFPILRAVELATGRARTLAGSPGVTRFVDGRGRAAAFSQPRGLALHVRARQLFVADPFNHAVRVVHVDSAEVRTLAGSGAEGSADGPGRFASFVLPRAVTASVKGA